MYKNVFSLMILTCLLILLYGCDYAEKSFRVLNSNDIPAEVTLDFELPRGYYGAFVWSTSNEEVIFIDDQNMAHVIQQDVDVDVIITATIKQQSERFIVTVLKTGSSPTLLEQATIALDQIMIPQEAILPFEVPTHLDQIYFEYNKANYYTNHYDITKKLDGSTWILPYLVDSNVENVIEVKAYAIDENNHKIALKTKTFTFDISVDHASIHPHLQVFQALEVIFAEGDSQHHVTQRFTLPLVSNIIERAILSWSVEMRRILIIDTDGKTVYIFPNEGTYDTFLIVNITIDELTYTMKYPITIMLD